MSLLDAMLACLLATEPPAILDLPEGADPNEYVQATWFAAVAAEPIEVPAWQAHWRGDETELLDTPRLIRHVTGQRETLDDIAHRYGTNHAKLRVANLMTLAVSPRIDRDE